MIKEAVIQEIKHYVEAKYFVSSIELIDLLSKSINNFKREYKNIYIKELCDQGIIYAYDVDKYKAYKNRKKYNPLVDEKLIKFLTNIKKDKNVTISYFDTSFYNSLSYLQSLKKYIYIGVESYAFEYISSKMMELGKEVISSSDLHNSKKILAHLNINVDFVLKNINEDTPLIKKRGTAIAFPKLEALLVDLLFEKSLRDIYETEIENIYKNAFKIYSIKINTLLRYAKKKKIEAKVLSLLDDINFDIKKGEFI